MNIFENYLSKINKIITDNNSNLGLQNLDSLKNVTLEVPPEHFNLIYLPIFVWSYQKKINLILKIWQLI